MDDEKIYNLVRQFREAIMNARDADLFQGDIVFERFPKACCGDTCYLLAEFLHFKGIDTIYVCGDDKGQSHAWLVVKDWRIKSPEPSFYDAPDEIVDLLNNYSGGAYKEPIDITHYVEDDLIEGLIIDITADQFGEVPVFVNCMDDFHRRFEFEMAQDYVDLSNGRLRNLYRKILRFI